MSSICKCILLQEKTNKAIKICRWEGIPTDYFSSCIDEGSSSTNQNKVEYYIYQKPFVIFTNDF